MLPGMCANPALLAQDALGTMQLQRSSSSLDAFGKRPRAKANKEVGVESYASQIDAWLSSQPLVEISVKVGPVLCTDMRSVTAASFTSIATLLNGFISVGLDNGVLQGIKLKEALMQCLLRSPSFLGQANLANVVPKISDHIQTVMSTLREAKYEENNQVSLYRRYPRTGGFRKKCMFAGIWPQVLQTMNGLKLESDTDDVTSLAICPYVGGTDNQVSMGWVWHIFQSDVCICIPTD